VTPKLPVENGENCLVAFFFKESLLSEACESRELQNGVLIDFYGNLTILLTVWFTTTAITCEV